MQEVNLKALLMNYNANLCDRQFAFILPKEKRLRIVFFRESLCHLMGLQHVFDWDKHYLGQKGYEKIKSEAVTVDTLKKHNKKGYSFIGWTLNNEIYNFSNPVSKDLTLVAKWEEK